MRHKNPSSTLVLLSVGLILALFLVACGGAAPAQPTAAPAAPKAAAPTAAPAAPAAPTAAAAAPVAGQKTWKDLKLQHYDVPSDTAARWNVIARWAKKVEELTNGRVTFKIYPQDELAKVAEMPGAAAKGTIDAYVTNEFYHTNVHPWLGWTFLPGSVDASKWDTDFIKLMNGGIWNIMDREFAKVGLKQALPFNGGPIFAFAMRGDYIKEAATAKGRKIRGAGGGTSELIKLMGGSVVSIAGPEVLPSLSSGVIDGALTSIDLGVYSWKWYEVAPYVSYFPSFPMNSWNVPVVMRKAIWDEFDEPVKKAFQDAAVQMQPVAAELVKKDTQWALDGLKKDNKIATWIGPDEVSQQYDKLARQPLREWWLKQAGDSGKEIITIIDKFYGRN